MYRTAIVLAVVAAAGCGSDSPTGVHILTFAPPPDVSTEIAAMNDGMVGGIAGVSTLLSLPTSTTLPTVTPSLCAYSGTTQGFTCPETTADGLTFDISYYLTDTSGRSQSSVDANSTASIRVVADTRGTVALPAATGALGAVTLSDHTDMTMSGLQAANRALNGTSVSHYDVTTTGTTSVHALIDMTTTAAGVTLPPQGVTPGWPTAGTVTTNATAVTSIGFLPSATTTAQTVVTFNGTSSPTVTVTIGGVTQSCKIDLTGKMAPSCN